MKLKNKIEFFFACVENCISSLHILLVLSSVLLNLLRPSCRAICIMVHGLHEHIQAYNDLATEMLKMDNIALHGYDQGLDYK